MNPDILEAALELGAPKPDQRLVTWDEFIGDHQVRGFAYSARPRCRILDGPRVPFGSDGLRMVRVELERPGSSWDHDQGVAVVDGDSIVSVCAHGVVFTEPAARGGGITYDLNTALYLVHPELWQNRRAAIYPAHGLKIVKQAFANLAELGVLVVPEGKL